jgi:hypothetical protein
LARALNRALRHALAKDDPDMLRTAHSSAWLVHALGALLAAGLVGCKPDIPESRFACSSSTDCPSGFSCVAARCSRHALDENDAGDELEAGVDPAAEPSSGRSNDAGKTEAGAETSSEAGAAAGSDAETSSDAGAGSTGAEPACGGAVCTDAFDCTIDRCGANGCEHIADDTRCSAEPEGRCDATSGCRYPTCSEASCADTACENARCEAGQCVKTPVCAPGLTCCNGTCWNGRCEDLEACRDQPASTACRAASDACDLPELCSGQGPTCPADRKAPVGSPCSGGSCNGLGQCIVGCIQGTPCATGNPCERGQLSCATEPPTCVAVGPATANTECRAAAGPCDVADKCNGVDTVCPADTLRAGDFVCRASAGVCDVPETCTGQSATCPANQFVSSAMTCRPAAAECDVAESCPGNAAACPGDGFQPSTATCRGAAGECDVAETCTGSHPSCPANALRSGDLCRGVAGDCDTPEYCDGANPSCPTDAFLGTSQTCRAATSLCDLKEVCPGNGPSCPADARRSVNEKCSGCSYCNAAGSCVSECTGSLRICCEGSWCAATMATCLR